MIDQISRNILEINKINNVLYEWKLILFPFFFLYLKLGTLMAKNNSLL